jgi:hypothetical protein
MEINKHKGLIYFFLIMKIMMFVIKRYLLKIHIKKLIDYILKINKKIA